MIEILQKNFELKQTLNCLCKKIYKKHHLALKISILKTSKLQIFVPIRCLFEMINLTKNEFLEVGKIKFII